MRSIHSPRTREERRYRRHLRVRKRIRGTAERPRLVVFRSLKHIYGRLVDDDRGTTLLGVGDTSEGIEVEGTGKIARARGLGVSRVVFDRAGYQYHGRVQAVAEGAREGGLEL